MKPQTAKEAAKQGVLNFYQDIKKDWLKKARQIAKRRIALSGEVCSDDIHRELPPPEEIDPRLMGSVFKGMKFVRFKKSERRECHHRTISVFTK